LLKDRCPTAFQLGLAFKDSGLSNGKPPLHRILFETLSKYMKVRKDGKTASVIVGYPRLKQDTGYERSHLMDTATEMELNMEAALAKEVASKERVNAGKVKKPVKLMKKAYTRPFLRREHRGAHAPKWIADVAYIWETAQRRDADYCRARAEKYAAYDSIQDEDGEDDFAAAVDPVQEMKDLADLDAMGIAQPSVAAGTPAAVATVTAPKPTVAKAAPAEEVPIDVVNADFNDYAQNTPFSRRCFYLALDIYDRTGRTTVTTSALKVAAEAMEAWAVDGQNLLTDEKFNVNAERIAWACSVGVPWSERLAKPAKLHDGCPVRYLKHNWGNAVNDNKLGHQSADARKKAGKANQMLVPALVAATDAFPELSIGSAKSGSAKATGLRRIFNSSSASTKPAVIEDEEEYEMPEPEDEYEPMEDRDEDDFDPDPDGRFEDEGDTSDLRRDRFEDEGDPAYYQQDREDEGTSYLPRDRDD
jgi:hypothetical protein